MPVNPANLVRPPVLNVQPGQSAGQSLPTSNSFSMDELTSVITNIVNNVLRTEGRNIVQAALNPNANFSNVTDITIDSNLSGNVSDLDKIPDVVRCLREFSGNPGEFTSWRKSVDRILHIYEPMKGTPKYYGILNVIRNKIVGNADTALESYNTPLDWKAISKCLTLHYADKRDLGTLEYQMTALVQGSLTIQEFYQKVYSHLSLILNKLGCMEVGQEAMHLLTRTYRDKALDTFVRGLKGDLPRLLGMREPVDLPQALHLCLKLENQNFRSSYALSNSNGNHNRRHQDFRPPLPPRRMNNEFYPELAHMPQPRLYAANAHRTPQINYQVQRPQQLHQQFNPPPRPLFKPQPRPEPMEIDQTLRSRHINYMNKPRNNDLTNKRPPPINPTPSMPPYKIQRNFHIDSEQYPTMTSDSKTNDNTENYNEEYYSNNDASIDENYIDTTDLHFLE